MRTLRHTLFVMALGISLSLSPMLEAQTRTRNNNGGGGHHRATTGVQNNRKDQPATPATRPGNNNNRPENGNRPGNNGNGNRPGNNSAPRPGQGGHYQPTPGPAPHPGNYRPPVAHRWERPLPPPPHNHYFGSPRPHVPVINAVLGLSFGSLYNIGVNVLINNGYNVIGTYDNMIYLSNVNQFGVIWPQVTMYYGQRGMQGARFQFGTRYPGLATYNTAYNHLFSMYGMPVGVTNDGFAASATWWGGNNVGYITLTYSQGTDQYGAPLYYTDMIYGVI